MTRRPVDRPIATGVRVLDGLLTLGEGQRVGLFAGSGVGKSTLLGAIARGVTADVVVVALVGERGREVTEFLDHALGPEGRARSVVVVATSDVAALERLRAAQVATAYAEPGTRIDAIVRGKAVPIEVTQMPFVPARYFRG